MGNDLKEENEPQDKEPEVISKDFIKYGIISRKGEEKSNDDFYLASPDITIKNNSKEDHFSLFGVFDGHNSNFVSKYIRDNIEKYYKEEIASINKSNYREKIENIFKKMDKRLKESNKDKNTSGKIVGGDSKDKKKGNSNTIISDKKDDDINYINIDVEEKELQFVKNSIKNSKDIPDEFKDVNDSELENLLIFKNLFKYNNNYIYNNNLNFIGASASLVLINNDNVITADLGITKCILFNKEGNILNKESKNNNNNSKNLLEVHSFNNSEEKKRIKTFNKSADYKMLKYNFYVPASRSFGFYKYKNDELLKEENQIISCVPDVYMYKKNDVDFILLATGGGTSAGESLKKFSEKIKKYIINKIKDDDTKFIKLIEDYIKYRKDEQNNSNKNSMSSSGTQSRTVSKMINSNYIGKEDFGEENIIINELNNSYYRDIMNINKTYDYCGKYNSTFILIQLLKKEDEEEKDVNKESNPDNEEKKDKHENKEVIDENKSEIKNIEKDKNKDGKK